MKKLITRFREIRKEEGGYGLTESLVAAGLGLSLMVAVLLPAFYASEIGTGFINSVRGVSQGPVADKAKEIHEAALKFREENPDAGINKQNVLADGKVQVSADMQWTVAEYQPNGRSSKPVICVVAYSTSQQTDVYTPEDPAEVNTIDGLGAKLSSGCYYTNPEGYRVPNYDEVVTVNNVPQPATYAAATGAGGN